MGNYNQNQGYGPYQGYPPGFAPPPRKKGMGAGTIALIVVACTFGGCIMLGVLASASSGNGASHSNAAAPRAALAKDPPIAVTSTELFSAYQANEIAADNAYKGRSLLVTGRVASIDKGAFGGLHLTLSTSNEFMSTLCSLEDSESARAAQLSKGQTVKVLCTGQGMTLGSPSLGDCTLQ